MLLSTSDVSKYLGDYSTSYADLIPAVISDFCDFTNNYFESDRVKLQGQIFDFSTTGTITVTGTNFSTWSFVAGDDIRVYGSCRNDGFYTISTITSNVLTVSSSQTIASEGKESRVSIKKISAPEAAKVVMSNMVKFRIENTGAQAQIESLGDYSVHYGRMDNGYPQSIISAMSKYTKVKYI